MSLKSLSILPVAAFGVGAAVWSTTAFLSAGGVSATPCEQMTSMSPSTEPDIILEFIVEAVTNSTEGAEEVQSRLEQELRRTAEAGQDESDDLALPKGTILVEFTVYLNGESVSVTAGPCPGGEWTIEPNPDGLTVWESATDAQRVHLTEQYREYQNQQTDLILETVKATIENLDFAAHGVEGSSDLILDPMRILTDLEVRPPVGTRETEHRVVLLAPWVSNVGDCLDASTVPKDLEVEAVQLLELCLADGQIPVSVQAADLDLLVYEAAHDSIATRTNAQDLAEVIQQHLEGN